jgi:hypothetical protein
MKTVRVVLVAVTLAAATQAGVRGAAAAGGVGGVTAAAALPPCSTVVPAKPGEKTLGAAIISQSGRFALSDDTDPDTAFVLTNHLVLADRQAGTATYVDVAPPQESNPRPMAADVSADGRFVLFVDYDPAFRPGSGTILYLYDRTSGTTTPIGSSANGLNSRLVFRGPNDRYIWATGSEGSLLYDRTTNSAVVLPANALDVSADARFVLSDSGPTGQADLHVLDRQANTTTDLPPIGVGFDHYALMTPDGDVLVTTNDALVAADTNGEPDLYRWSRTTHQWTVLAPPDQPVGSIEIWPASQGSRFVMINGRLVYDTVTGTSRVTQMAKSIADATGEILTDGSWQLNGAFSGDRIVPWTGAIFHSLRSPDTGYPGDEIGAAWAVDPTSEPVTASYGPDIAADVEVQPNPPYLVGNLSVSASPTLGRHDLTINTPSCTETIAGEFDILDPRPTIDGQDGGFGHPGEPVDVTFSGQGFDQVSSVTASDGATASVVSQSSTSLSVHVVPTVGYVGTVDLTLNTRPGFAVQVPGAARFEGTEGEYVPIDPRRLLDTRFGTGGRNGALNSNETIDLQVAGMGGVPAAAQVDSVLLNVTVTQPTGYGFLTIFPAGGARPNASNLNFVPGQTVPNMVSAKLSALGKVSIYTSAGTHVIVDVVGYFSSATGPIGARLLPVTPTRVFDSRFDAPTFPYANYDEAICGFSDLDGIESVVLNVTAVNADQSGWVTLFSGGQMLRPPTSNLNVASAAAVANMVVVKPGADGCVEVNTSIDAVDLIVDMTGVFIKSTDFPGPVFASQSPMRVLDTRSGIGAPAKPVTAYQPLTLSLAGQIPAGTSAVVLNITVTQPTQGGYVTVWPADEPMPLASSLNFLSGQTVPNLVLVPVSADGKVKLMASGGTHLIADLAGSFSG